MCPHEPASRRSLAILLFIALVFCIQALMGLTWGLPSREIDKYLFGEGEPWSGERIYELAGAAARFDPQSAPRRGADVDINPVSSSSGDAPVSLNATEDDVARILLRYRLYTYQPDEMITMMALSSMRPGNLDFDPRLYQYGGLFLYPVGAMIKLGDVSGLIDVRSDVVFYLDHPDEFGKFYVAARLYAAAWGLLGVFVVFGIGRRLAGSRAGIIAAALFVLLPVVVCMSHEGKPHLPGAVLMLSAVWFAMRYLDRPGTTLDWWMMCICCGAAFGMVLSSLPIFVLIPVVAWMERGRPSASRREVHQGMHPTTGADCKEDSSSIAVADESDTSRRRILAAQKNAPHPAFRIFAARIGYVVWRTVVGVALAAVVYLLTNPYIIINAFTNREVLRSNFGNSLAMYEVARIGEGFVRVLQLTTEGATLPVLVLGVVALVIALYRRNWVMLPLLIPAAVFFLQFVLIGAGKPGEYGRFGIFADTALAIGSACLLGQKWTSRRDILHWLPGAIVALFVAVGAFPYLSGFRADAERHGTRARLAADLREASSNCEQTGACSSGSPLEIVVLSDPAPYSLPPVRFDRVRILRVDSMQIARRCVELEPRRRAVVVPTDRRRKTAEGMFVPASTPISWADKPFLVVLPDSSGPVDAVQPAS
ncbi:MAG: glycosyltransferase family 39 protein [Phycisphaerae bacterium]|nr:glycosyltransferase family 39 protein [Phycisphaerae bacterium]